MTIVSGSVWQSARGHQRVWFIYSSIIERLVLERPYGLKWLKRDSAAYDHLLILPVAKSELPPKQAREPTPAEPTPWEFEPGLKLWG